MYLLGEDDRNYELMKLVNMELAFDVDVSQLGCGMNGALYFSEMDVSGSRSDLNPAGAAYGTGECDAQCFQDQNFTVRVSCFTLMTSISGEFVTFFTNTASLSRMGWRT